MKIKKEYHAVEQQPLQNTVERRGMNKYNINYITKLTHCTFA